MDNSSPKPPAGSVVLLVGVLVDDGPCPECGESRSGDGPTRVNTHLFRDGWDRIISGKKSDAALAN